MALTAMRVRGAAELEHLGSRLAKQLEAGALVLLEGAVGVGKSVLARGCVRELVQDPLANVPSPSYLLEQEYVSARLGMVRHFDLYRLQDEFGKNEWHALGWDDVLFKDVCLVEWPECAMTRLGRKYPGSPAWRVQVSFVPLRNDLREVQIEKIHL